MSNYIYIGFSSPKKFKIGASLIKFWQRRPFSHTYIRFDSEEIPSTVYHAAHGMLHFRESSLFEMDNHIFCEFKIPVTDRKQCLIDCIYLSGEKYGYLELFKIFIYDIMMNLGFKLKFDDSKGFICSELVAGILDKYTDVEFNKPYFLLTPRDVFESLKRNVDKLIF